MGEPGKFDVSKAKKKYGNVPTDKLPVERLAGAVVFAKHEGDIFLALVHDVFGHWTLPKRKLEGAETVEDGVEKKVPGEIGIPVKIVERLGTNAYSTYHPEKGKIKK